VSEWHFAAVLRVAMEKGTDLEERNQERIQRCRFGYCGPRNSRPLVTGTSGVANPLALEPGGRT